MLGLAGALRQAPCKTCKRGVSETVPSNPISFPLQNKNKTKRNRNRAGSLAMGNLFPQVGATGSVRGTAVPSSVLGPSSSEELFQEVLV